MWMSIKVLFLHTESILSTCYIIVFFSNSRVAQFIWDRVILLRFPGHDGATKQASSKGSKRNIYDFALNYWCANIEFSSERSFFQHF